MKQEQGMFTRTENDVEEFVATAKEYVVTRYDLIRLKAVSKSTTFLASAIVYSIAAVFGCFFLFFVSYAAAGYLSDLMENKYSGFLMIGAFYFLLAMLLLILNKKYFHHPLVDKFIREFLKEH